MFSYLAIRWFTLYLLLIPLSVLGSSDLFDDQFIQKDEDYRNVDLFNMGADVLEKKPDPVEKKVDKITTREKETDRAHTPDHSTQKPCPPTHTIRYQTVVAAYRSFIQNWLSNLPSDDTIQYRVTIDLSPSELRRLRRFAFSADYEQDNVLRDVHDTTECLKRNAHISEDDKKSSTSVRWLTWTHSHDVYLIIIGVLALLILIYIMFRLFTHLPRLIVSIFIASFIGATVQNCLTLYQDAQAKIESQLLKGLPEHCHSHSMGVWESTKTFLSNFFYSPVDVCLEHQKVILAKAFSQATLSQAISMTITDFFVTPLGPLGEALSKFFAGVMRHIPTVMVPFVILITLFIILVLLFQFSGRNLRLSLPFFTFELTARAAAAIPINNNNQDQILNQLQNTIIQLRDETQQLRLQLEQQANLQLQL